jgi:hypothetical protein
LETVITSFVKSMGLDALPEVSTNDNNTSSSLLLRSYLEILKPLSTLAVEDDVEVYRLFRTIVTNYIPRDVFNPHGLPFHIFRLILLYHEPEVCNVLDSLRVRGAEVAREWVSCCWDRAKFCKD